MTAPERTAGRVRAALLQALGWLVSLGRRVLSGRLARRTRLWGALRRVYLAVVGMLVARTGLFDADYYAEHNQDVVRAGWSPLRHYVHVGEREGRQPMPLFDPAYYRQQLGAAASPLNCLLHYAWVGRARGLSPSPWFNVPYYLDHNPDIAASGEDPLRHYLRHGAVEGRSPCPAFDGLYYLKANPDVAAARVNPLVHYLRFGRAEGRRALPGPGEALDDLPPTPVHAILPTPADWAAAVPHADGEGLDVDVIVPVYKGRSETLRCLLSVLTDACSTRFALVVIDDASPDPELSADLRELAARGLFTLLVNDKNRGFVGTVNRGMALHPDRDVVLLNADTEVYADWLDRLRASARRDPSIASVTPLSNNATICSYPRPQADNPFPLEIGYAELDRLAARVNRGVEIEAPTGVGFCMYLRRDALDRVGLFDEQAYGRGYGEENDFCQRAARQGLRNLICPDVFVRHWGSTSFAGETQERVRAALAVVERRYPGYLDAVGRFIAADPLRAARRALDWERFRLQARGRNVLIVCHSRGGGTERQVREDVTRLQADGRGVFILRPALGAAGAVLTHPQVKAVPNLAPFALRDLDALERACRELGIVEVRAHSFVDFAPGAPAAIQALAQRLGARLEMRIHDYAVICPRINLADENGRYCGEPDVAGCNRCLATRGSEFAAAVDIAAWRREYEPVLRAAERVAVPDLDVATRLQRYFPGLRLTVTPHEEPAAALADPPLPVLAPDEPLRIVILGAISRYKGLDILRACAEDARRRRLPLEFVLMGYSADDLLLQKHGVRITGRYDEHEALATLQQLQPHAVWLPSTWPETYSYTLSLALAAAQPVFAFDFGAIASRLRALDHAQHLMPVAMMTDAAGINARFLAFRDAALAARAAAVAARPPSRQQGA